MRVFDSLEAIEADEFAAGTVIAIGKFDGVHLGHHALLDRVATIAESRGLEPLVFTFANNPLSLLRPESCPDSIMSLRQRLQALEAAGVEACVMVPFDAELALQRMVERWLGRFQEMERRLRAEGLPLSPDSLDRMERIWKELGSAKPKPRMARRPAGRDFADEK